MKALLIAFAVVLSGCSAISAATRPASYGKPNTTSADFDADKGQCSAQAYSISNPYPGQIMQVFDACMKGKGWRRS
jgi:uncharacterized protein YceK